MAEISALAARKGVTLPEDLVARTLSFVDTLPAGGTASMQRDIANNRQSELESWNGAVVRLAAEVDLEVPAHARIYGALREKIAQPGRNVSNV
jgi:2-dehydropantoate 2-reductase